MKTHYFDTADGGICIKCDRCRHPECCPQTEECDGTNWDFMNRTYDEWKTWLKDTDHEYE